MIQNIQGNKRNPPQKLYKFRAVMSEIHLCRLEKILLEHELYSSSPQYFNDPFDCRVPPVGNIDSSFARYLICPSNPSHETGNLSSAEYQQLREVFEKTQENINKSGVLALGANRVSTLMWSHYAQDHCGVALEFDTAKWIAEMPYMNGQFHPVTYSEVRIKWELTRADFDQAQFFNATILTKDICWKSEEEWRIITKTPGPLKFPVSALTGIIFGCLASDTTKARLRNICSRFSSVTLYQAKMKTQEFGLDFVPD